MTCSVITFKTNQIKLDIWFHSCNRSAENELHDNLAKDFKDVCKGSVRP
jgi:hypothetical protein